jgi:hypothetical protein
LGRLHKPCLRSHGDFFYKPVLPSIESKKFVRSFVNNDPAYYTMLLATNVKLSKGLTPGKKDPVFWLKIWLVYTDPLATLIVVKYKQEGGGG